MGGAAERSPLDQPELTLVQGASPKAGINGNPARRIREPG